MKILLAIPTDTQLSKKESVLPLGTAYIQGALKAAGFDVLGCNLNYVKGDINDYLHQIITENNIDVFMIGGTSFHMHAMRDLFYKVKRINPKIVTIGGGAGYTAQPELLSRLTKPDYAVLGEGEETTCELMKTLAEGGDVKSVRGIIYRTKNGYVKTPERPLIKDINQIPFPCYDGFGVEEYFGEQNDYSEATHFDYAVGKKPRIMPIIFGRSCPYNCRFCFHTVGRTYRARSFENFFAEVESMIEQYHITGIMIMDEFFGVRKETVMEFCDRIEKYGLQWFAELRVDCVDEEMLRRMKASGCTNLLLGLESINQDILDDMNKQITVEQIKTTMESAYNSGLNISGNFIIGSPLETLDSFYETFDWWNKHRKLRINLLFLQLYPGTQYYKDAVKNGLVYSEEAFLEQRIPEINVTKMNPYEWDKVRRIIQLTQMDNNVSGILDIVGDKPNQMLRLKCSHCGEVSVCDYTDKIWNRYTHKCPSCHHKTSYSFNIVNSRTFENEIYKQYAMNNAYGYDMKRWIDRNNYKNVILYGKGNNLALMIREMKKHGVNIVGITHRDVAEVKMYENTVYYENTLNLEELSYYPEADAVILCSTAEYHREVQLLRSYNYHGRVDSMTNAILDHDFFIEDNQ